MAKQSNTEVKQNLKALQDRISKSAQARAAFLKDPAAALSKTGMELTAARAKSINGFVEKQLRTPGAKVSGAAIRPLGAANDVEVTVSVGVKF
jgi:hypothetical protein